MFRLHIDFALGEDEARAAEISLNFIKNLKDLLGNSPHKELDSGQYRLANDTDRVQRNYLDKNENGHAKTNKTKLF